MFELWTVACVDIVSG